MITLSKPSKDTVKKVHCPICGGRICDAKATERISFVNSNDNEIVLKCYKCGNRIGVSIVES